MTNLLTIYLKGDWGSLLGAEKSESSNHTCSNQDGARCKTQLFISIGVMANIYSTYDEQTFRSLLYDNRRIGEGKKFKSSYRDKLRQVSSNLLVSTPVKVLQLPPPPAVSPIRLMRTVEVGNWFFD